MAILELRDVHAYYGNIHALKGISLAVEPGEIVTLIGSNGAGKSTTLKTISGLLRPRHGEILFEGERNAGNDVRRVGEEGLFEMLVEHNVGQLEKARFRRIVTTDPHTLNTLRFEYPQFGTNYEGWHYSELLSALFRDGHLTATAPVPRRVTYHDPCYLARYSEVTIAPREVLAAVGAELVEMPRNRANTFCCGAGGGRIWMDDSGLRERPSEQRMREAATLDGADARTLRETLDKLKDKLKTAAIVLASVEGGKVQLAAGVTADSTARVKAGELVNFVAQQVGGKGGGKPDLAMAGGSDPAALPRALASVVGWVGERV